MKKPVKGRHSSKRNASFALKSTSELQAIYKRGSLASACAWYHLKERGAHHNVD